MNMPLTARIHLDITCDGTALAQPLLGSLLEATVQQGLCAPAVAELTFANPPMEATRTLGLGCRLTIRAGGHLFEGTITSFVQDYDGSRDVLVRITAHDALQVLRQRQTVQAITHICAAGLAQKLAADLGLTSRSLEPAPERELLIQHEQTDLDLLCDLAADCGLYPVLRENTLLLVSLAGDGESPAELRMGRSLLSARIGLARDRSIMESTTDGIDLSRIVPRRGTVGLSRQDREEMRDLGRDAPRAKRHLTNRLTDGDAEAEALAQAVLDRAAAREGSAEGVAEGDATLTPGRLMSVSGVAPLLEGRYIATRVLHRFTADAGYVTEFSTEPPARPTRTRAAIAAVGKVSQIDDPDGLGRCRVKLPALGDVETGWMQVLMSGAGAGRGLTALPHVDDDVLVLCPDGDPARGVVMGSLYGNRRLPRGADGKAERGVVVRSGNGQALELSGKGGTARLLNNGGSLVELAPGRMRLAAACDLLIEAPGRRLTIRAADIHFERG